MGGHDRGDDDTLRRGRAALLRVVLLGALTVMPGMQMPARAENGPAMSVAPVRVAIDPAVAALAKAMRLDKTIAVMRTEGLDYARTLETDMFPGRGGRAWTAEVEAIYDPDRMRDEFLQGLSSALSGAPGLSEMTAFMSGAFGQRAVALELAAREALIDPAAEDAAKVAWLELKDAGGVRTRQIERFAAVNDLMDSNITGAMNANLAFYRGLMEASPPDMAMTEEDITSMVAGQQAQIEGETADWLFPYLTLAYEPLTDAELDSYIAFSESASGQRLNRALFSAFAGMFDRISYDLGAAAGRRMQGQDI